MHPIAHQAPRPDQDRSTSPSAVAQEAEFSRQKKRKPSSRSISTPRRVSIYEQPEIHSASLSKDIVRPLNGKCTLVFVARMNVSVLVPAMTLPSFVATSFACDAITASGLIRLSTT
jgi:CCR4-NOT transcriptional regulation complex NOT5 subunit